MNFVIHNVSPKIVEIWIGIGIFQRYGYKSGVFLGPYLPTWYYQFWRIKRCTIDMWRPGKWTVSNTHKKTPTKRHLQRDSHIESPTNFFRWNHQCTRCNLCWIYVILSCSNNGMMEFFRLLWFLENFKFKFHIQAHLYTRYTLLVILKLKLKIFWKA